MLQARNGSKLQNSCLAASPQTVYPLASGEILNYFDIIDVSLFVCYISYLDNVINIRLNFSGSRSFVPY
jgi:hypothetical protein